MGEFAWFSPQAPPRGFREVPPGGFCVSVFLVVRDAEGRVLVGRYEPDHPELERLTGMDPERRARHAQGFTLPARHLRLGESPAEAARSIARDLVRVATDAPRLLRAWSESYGLATYGGHTHHDLLLAYEARPAAGAQQPEAPPWYAELRFAWPHDVAWARGHDDVLRALARRVDLPFQGRWRPLVLSGQKTTTVRTKRFGAPGDAFEVDGARFTLTAVEPMPLARARDAVWREEGMSGPEEFERVWAENHPTRGFRPQDAVWVHRFRRDGGGPSA